MPKLANFSPWRDRLSKRVIHPPTVSQKARGRIESIYSAGIRGWVYVENDEHAEIHATVNDKTLARGYTNVDRPGLQKRLGSRTCCGFDIPFSNLDSLHPEKINHIKITEVNSGFTFDRETHVYCPLVRKNSHTLRDMLLSGYYRKKYSLEDLSKAQIESHYLQTGIYLDYDPNPWFSSSYFREHHSQELEKTDIPIIAYLSSEDAPGIKASNLFDPAIYRLNNPDLCAKSGLLKHYAQYGHREGRVCLENAISQQILEETEELAELEPQLGSYFQKQKQVIEYPTLQDSTYVPQLIRNRFENDIRVVICVPFISVGGADLISTYILSVFQKQYGLEHVLLLVTDRSENVAQQWLSDNTNVVYLDKEAKFTSLKEKTHTLHCVIGLLSPEKIVNINSHASWEMYYTYGRQLSTRVDLYAYLFCFDYTNENTRKGYIVDYIPKTVQYLKRVFCDNQTVINDMQNLYGFSDKNRNIFQAVYVPVSEKLKQLEIKESNPYKQKILWVGRLSRQKRPHLLVQIAENMPDTTFTVYGPPGDSDISHCIANNQYKNIEYRGVFKDIIDLDLQEYALYLNTSAWEGLPTIIIQMMTAGLPIVSSDVGGINELVNNMTGRLVENHNCPASYHTAILETLSNYSDCLEKAKNGRLMVQKRHNWQAFESTLESVGAFSESTESVHRAVL